MSGCTVVWSEESRRKGGGALWQREGGRWAWTPDTTPPPPPPLKERLPDFPEPSTRGTAGQGLSRGRDGGGQAHLVEEGPEEKAARSARVGHPEQEAGGTDHGGSSQSGGQGGAGCLAGSQGGPSRTGASSGALKLWSSQALSAPGTERDLERTLSAPGTERDPERTLSAPGTERDPERTLSARLWGQTPPLRKLCGRASPHWELREL